jgi:hypothetical protein
MKKVFKILIFSLFAITAYAQQATEIDSKSVRLPRYASEAAVTAAIPTPTQGMLIYRTDTKSNWYFDGTVWKDMVVSSVSVPSPLYLTSTSTTIVGETNQADEAGVMGVNTTDGVSFGVLGRASHIESLDGGAGVKGENLSTNESGYGVMGTHNGVGWAGYFEGYNALKTQGNTYLNGNVGIGTDSPWGKLAINTQGANHNVPSLLLTDDASNNEGGAILQFRNLADKRMYLQSHFGTQSNGTDSYLTFSHNATYNMRLRGDGNLGIGSINPNLAGLVVNKKVGNSHAIFGDNTSGVSIESNFPGIHFNSYFNGSRKTISTGFTAGAEMNPTTGDFSIYTSPLSTMAGSTASVFERLKITKDGVVNVAGKMKVGDDPTVAAAGTMRYNQTTNDFEGFDGTIWKSFTKNSYNNWGVLSFVRPMITESEIILSGVAEAKCIASENYMALLFQATASDPLVTKFYHWENDTWTYMNQINGNLIKTPQNVDDYNFYQDSRMTDDWLVASDAITQTVKTYKRTGNTWAFHSSLTLLLGIGYGYSWDVDQNNLFISAPFAQTNSGIVIHYKFNGTSWIDHQVFQSPFFPNAYKFGSGIRIKNDYLAISYGSTAPGRIEIYKVNSGSFNINSNIFQGGLSDIYYEGSNVRIHTSGLTTGLYKINSSGLWELIPNTDQYRKFISGFAYSGGNQSDVSLYENINDTFSEISNVQDNFAQFGSPVLTNNSLIIPSSAGKYYKIYKK